MTDKTTTRFRVGPVGRSLNALNFHAKRNERIALDAEPCANCRHLTHSNRPELPCSYPGCECQEYLLREPAIGMVH